MWDVSCRTSAEELLCWGQSKIEKAGVTNLSQVGVSQSPSQSEEVGENQHFLGSDHVTQISHRPSL